MCRVIRHGSEMTDKYLRWCRRELSMSHKDYESCGEISATGLAEACAEELEAYVDFEEFEILPEVFDAAAEAALEWERAVIKGE